MKTWVKGLICATVIGSVLTAEAFPLRVDIDVSTKRDRKMVGAGDSGEVKMETVTVKVKVRKSGGDIPEGKLFAELYVIGKQLHTGYYGIIDVQKGEFELLQENQYTAEYTSPPYTLTTTGGNIKAGGVSNIPRLIQQHSPESVLFHLFLSPGHPVFAHLGQIQFVNIVGDLDSKIQTAFKPGCPHFIVQLARIRILFHRLCLPSAFVYSMTYFCQDNQKFKFEVVTTQVVRLKVFRLKTEG